MPVKVPSWDLSTVQMHQEHPSARKRTNEVTHLLLGSEFHLPTLSCSSLDEGHSLRCCIVQLYAKECVHTNMQDLEDLWCLSNRERESERERARAIQRAHEREREKIERERKRERERDAHMYKESECICARSEIFLQSA